MNADRLLELYEQISEAPDAIARLRRFVLDLAVRGKLVEQNPADEPAHRLMRRIEAEKDRLAKAGEIRKRDTKPVSMLPPPFELPATWCWTAVGSSFVYDAGTKTEPKNLDANRWLLELEDVEKETGRLLQYLKVADRKAKSTKSEFRAGDVLYGKLRPYLNKVVVADEAGYSTTEIVAIRPYLPLCSEYIALAFRCPDFVDYVERKGQGTKMPRLRTEDAVVAPFPLPPLAEQHRIVAKVDELMALCDQLEEARKTREETRDKFTAATLTRLTAPEAAAASKTDTTNAPSGAAANQAGPESAATSFPSGRASEQTSDFRTHAHFAIVALPALTSRPDQIKSLRQTILNLAVRGRLVEQDPEDEPISTLLTETRKELGPKAKISKPTTLTDIELPASWTASTLSQLCSFENGDRSSNYPSGPDIKTDGIPFFSTKNLKDHRLQFSHLDYISAEKYASLRSGKLRDGDILITLRGSVGKFGVFKADDKISTGFINAQLLIIRAVNRFTVPYLTLYMRSSFFDVQVLQLSSGSATPQLSAGKLATATVFLPPLAEQHRIVAKVDALMALCDRLEAALTTADTTRTRLLETLLHEALEPAAEECMAAE